MKGVKFLVVFVVLLLLPVSAIAQVIEEVQIEGNRRIESGTILLQVQSKAGELFDKNLVEKDVKSIYRTGYFDQVFARVAEHGASAIVLTFEVVEKPAIRTVTIEGNEQITEDNIKEKLTIGARRFIDPRKIREGIQQTIEYYESKGMYGTTIDYETSAVGDNEVDLHFTVDEGEKKYVVERAFQGNEAVSDDTLEDELLTKDYSFWLTWITGRGIVRKEMLDADVQALNRYYLTNGYADVKVFEPVIEEVDEGLRVVYKIKEGEVYSFGEVSASGTLLEESEEKTLDGTKVSTGETFNIDSLREDTFSISDKFTDIGYAFANVDPRTKINREEKRVDVNFVVNKGNVVTVDKIILSGNKKTRDNVIRRSLQISEREQYSSSKIKRSQQLLQRLGYFDEVTITPTPSDVENEVNLSIAVREGSTGTFTIGGGVSSGDGFIFSARVTETNLFGTGHSLQLDVNTGTRREASVLSYTNPRVNDTRWSAGVDLLKVEREFDDFDRVQAGGAIRAGYPLWFLGEEYLDDVRFTLTYQLQNVEIKDVDDDAPQLVIEQEGKSTISSITPELVRNTINNPLDPRDGSRQTVEVELAGIGGEEEFWLAQLANTVYVPMTAVGFDSLVFSNRTKFGWGETYDGEDFPLIRRFFLGGINSIRGFDTRELGPKDAEGNEFGGNKMFESNFEVIFPVAESLGLKGVLFYDIGNAFDDDESISVGEFRHAIGWGIRWRSPLAPIRIEFGYPIDREEGEKSIVTNFSFGSPL